MPFLHGVEVVEVTSGARPIQTQRSAVIGLIGTAPDADESAFPLDTPVLVTSRQDFADISDEGSLPEALNDIFKEAGAVVVVVRVEEGDDDAETAGNIIGGVDTETGDLTGVQAFRGAESLLGVTPMILIAPSFTSERPGGLTGHGAITAGTGGTAGTFALAFSGGTGSGAAGTFTVASGGVTAITITAPGRYSVVPTAVFTASSGLSGAASTLTLGNYANPVVSALLSVAAQLRAHVIAEGPSTTDADAITYRGDWGSRRVYIVDPKVKATDATGAIVSKPVSPFVAGLMAKVDDTEGFWVSPSNHAFTGVLGLDRVIDYALGDSSARANILNENEIATVIRDDGFRLWGNRTASDDAKWAFLPVSRTADIIDVSIQKAHRWAVDKAITRGYFEDVVASVNGYMRQLKARGAILGGKCWVDPALNTSADITAGHATFSYEFTPVYPSERVTFNSAVTDAYISTLFS